MTAVLVDSNVLIDVLTDAPDWGPWSAAMLARVAETAPLVVNAVIYSEVSIRFSRIEDVEEALPRALFRREHIPYEAAFLAGKIFIEYRRNGGSKASPPPDFFIGAHAAVAGYKLLTRDAVRYRTYFRNLELIAPRP